jgi:hypothetical protein
MLLRIPCASPNTAVPGRSLEVPWIRVAGRAPYFVDEDGSAWTPVGQNDGITWHDLNGIFRQRDLASVEAYLQNLVAHGVTCLRLMLEYSQTSHRYIERTVGTFWPDMVRLWDDMFALCRKWGLRILLTPFDTFWMWSRWKKHPYYKGNGGPCKNRRELLLCKDTRRAIKDRLTFATEQWGSDGTLFAWDLWNELHPAWTGGSADGLADFVEDMSTHLSAVEKRIHGAAHLQTVSVFTPAFELDTRLPEIIYRHPCLDFANIHLYEEGTIDHPSNTLDAAVSTGNLVASAISEIRDGRPFFDSEHGPIHSFKDHHKNLDEAFDDEYFRHIQWAHLASGGAGGGMRWPNRRPHSLTPGMRKAQKAMADFLPLIDWPIFQRVNRSSEVRVSHPGVHCFACGGDNQAVVYLLRSDTVQKNGMLDPGALSISPQITIHGLTAGRYKITSWDTKQGVSKQTESIPHFNQSSLRIQLPNFTTDLALAIVSQPHA